MRGKSILLLEPGSFLKRVFGTLWEGLWARDHDLAVLRHELRTPLTGILGMAALLRESRLDAEQLQYLAALEQSGQQLANLLARPGDWLASGRFKSIVSVTGFNGLHLLESITRAHWPVARQKRIELFLVFDHRLPAFWRTDAALLREALDNLLTNAIKFTPSGGYILLEARRFGGNERAGKGIELRVSDTGAGIPRRDGRRIYSFAQRGSGEHVHRRGGSGYGLFICDRIAGALGGSLDHRRGRSGGACFMMRLPGAALPMGAATERLRPKLLLGTRCQVSLSPPLDRVVAHALRRMGITVSLEQRNDGGGWPRSRDARITGCFPHEGGLREFSSVLPEPVLHANLEPLMLQLVLHSRMNTQ